MADKFKHIIEVEMKNVSQTKRKLKELDTGTKKLGGSTEKASNQNKALGSSFKSMAIKAGLSTVALMATVKALKFATSVGMKFEQAMANVKAISGATSLQFKQLEVDAKRLGASTRFTASEVAGLQLSFSKLGFTATEITKVTEGTLALASAVGADLARSAEVAGSTLRGFDLDAGETTRVTDVMAKSFSSSALDMEKFAESMKFVAPVAESAGFTIEGTTAIMAKMADVGIHGSLAGTALKNIFIELSKENGALSERLGGTVSSMEELAPALVKLKDEGLSLSEAIDLVGKRSAPAFLALVKGSGDLDVLTESFKNAGGSAQEMAEIQLDTLEGSVTILKSATEGLGIALFETFGDEMKTVVESVTSLIQNWTINLELQKTQIDINSEAFKLLGEEAQNSALIARQATLEQAIELEKNPSLLATIWGFNKKISEEYLNQTMHLDKIKGLAKAVWGETALEDITSFAQGLSVDTEKIKEYNEELKELRHEADLIEFPDLEWGVSEDPVIEMPDFSGETLDDSGWGVSEEDLNSINEASLAYVAWEKALIAKGEVNQQELDWIAQLKEENETLARSLGFFKDEDKEQEAFDRQVERYEDYLSTIEMLTLGGTDLQIAQIDRQEERMLEMLDKLANSEITQEEKDKQKKKITEAFDKKRLQTRLQNYASYFKSFDDLAKLAGAKEKSIAITKATVDGLVAVQKAWASLPFPLNLPSILATVAGTKLQIDAIKAQEFATGGSFVTSGETPIIVGDNPSGRESVEITPIEEGDPTDTASQNLHFNISGNVMTQDFVEEELASLVKNAIRKGSDFGIS